MQKKVLAINDISCVGRCSLTVALPIISSASIECSILPTAILSTHTGGFSGYTFLDFTNEMEKISAHWESLNRKFDTIYTGFLGSKDQVDVVINIVKKFKDNNLVIVDPAMADNGELYKIFDSSFPSEMKKLCKMSDIVIPNITEACLITNSEYIKNNHTDEYIDMLIEKLVDEGMKNIVLTGVSKNEGKVGAVCFDYNTKEKYYYELDLIDGYYHGTGDVFASVLTGAITKGKSLKESMEIAVDVTVDSIKQTIKYEGIDFKYGVCFEESLSLFINKLNN